WFRALPADQSCAGENNRGLLPSWSFRFRLLLSLAFRLLLPFDAESSAYGSNLILLGRASLLRASRFYTLALWTRRLTFACALMPGQGYRGHCGPANFDGF